MTGLPTAPDPARARTSPRAPSVAVLSTYPPTRCGLATFSSALVDAMAAVDPGRELGVVAVDTDRRTHPRVVGHLAGGGDDDLAATAAVLGRHDAVIVQFEYGIFPGPDGAAAVRLLRRLPCPAVTVLHTVLAAPTPSQRRVLEQVAAASAAVVVMTEVARSRLAEHHAIDPDLVWVIPHGSSAPAAAAPAPPAAGRPTMLTWGLLGPGKGIELAIDALAELRDLEPAPRYVVAGQTHPKVREHAGEAYRRMLMDRARDLGVDDMVVFDDRYLDGPTLAGLLQGADLVVLPYESREQVTSGVLVDAIASGRPVVATAFPHAVEVCALGTGLTVPHGDAGALAGALRRVLTGPDLADRLRSAAWRIGRGWSWHSIAGRHLRLVDQVTGRRDVVPGVPVFGTPASVPAVR